MKKYQRKLAFMMATVLLIGVIPANAIATEEENTAINTQSTEGEIDFTCGENAEWKLEEGVLTISGTGDMYDYSSTEAAPWVDFVEQITSVVIEEGITTIGDYAFYGCSNLTTVENKAEIIKVGQYAFYKCSKLTGIELGDKLESVGDYAFYQCSRLTDVVLSEGLRTIGHYAFYTCRLLDTIRIPGTVYDIGNYAFSYCYLKSLTLSEGIEMIGNGAFGSNHIVTLKIPNTVTKIGEMAFEGSKNLTEITIGNAIEIIGNMAFGWGKQIKKVVFTGDAPTKVGSDMFYGSAPILYYPKDNATWTEETKSKFGNVGLWVTEEDVQNKSCGENAIWSYSEEGVLTISGTGEMWDYKPVAAMPWAEYLNEITSVVIEEGITTIGDYAFYGCSNLTTVENKAEITKVGQYAFYRCSKLTGIELGDKLESVGDYAFYQCSRLTDVVLSEGLRTIGHYAFCECRLLDTIWIPGTVYDIGNYAFSYCYLKSLTLSEGIEMIGNGAFQANDIVTLKIPNTVTKIGEMAFSTCSKLTEITIGNAIEIIGNMAFSWGEQIKKVVFTGDAPIKVGSTMFYESAPILYYPKDNTTWTEEERAKFGSSIVFTPGLPIVQKETHSLTLNGDIGLNFYITPEGEYSIGSGRMWIDGKIERHHQKGDKHSDGRVKFTAHTAAAEMSKDVYYEYDGVRIATNEDVLSCDYNYSVQDYAEVVFGSNSAAATTELKNLLASMLNYGAFAQNYFDVNTSALANQNLGNWGYSSKVDSSIVDDVEVRFEANANGDNHATFTTNSLILESYTKLRFFYTLDASVDTSKVYMAYRIEGSGDAFAYAPLETRSGKYYGTIEDVAAAHLSDNYEVFVCEKDGDNYKQISDTKLYSAECYANTVLQKSNDEELKQAVIGMIAYGKMAKEYFGK